MTDPLHDIDPRIERWLNGETEFGPHEGEQPVGNRLSARSVESLVVHGLLKDLGARDEARDLNRIRAVFESIEAEEKPSPSSWTPMGRRMALVSAAAALALSLLFLLVFDGPNPVRAAPAELERLIAVSQRPIDRTYRIRVVEEYPKDRRPRDLPAEVEPRRRKEQIDGATLYVRGSNQYVLIRKLLDGRLRITGCDGKESWAFREDSPVHVSSDLKRFRGGMPGHRQEFLVLDLHSNLQRLRQGYDLELASRAENFNGKDLPGMIGTRKSQLVRGPKRVELWYDSQSGTIHKMFLDGLPRGGGGPKSVVLELTDQSELGEKFFFHRSHHEPNRRIKYEEPR